MNNSKDKHGASQPEMKQVMNQPELTKQQVDTIISERDLVFIDPLSDFGFKRLLGSERNKEITLHLLNTFIGDDIGTITDITFIASEMVGFLPGKKKVRLDVHCKTQYNDHVIIEMQRERQEYFINRLRVYTSHSTISGVKTGDVIYETVPKVYSICFMEKDMPEFKGRERFFWKIYYKDDDNEIFSKENIFYFAELCKFAAHLGTLDLSDEKNLWLYLLTHVADISEVDVRKMSPIYQRFYNECLISNLTDMEKKIYVRDVLEYADVKESLMCEREEGRKEGRTEGRIEEKRLLACNMLAEGLNPDVVARISGLTKEEVLALAQK
jgi:conserved hypothetical protein (putative transposase or invertase)